MAEEIKTIQEVEVIADASEITIMDKSEHKFKHGAYDIRISKYETQVFIDVDYFSTPLLQLRYQKYSENNPMVFFHSKSGYYIDPILDEIAIIRSFFEPSIKQYLEFQL